MEFGYQTWPLDSSNYTNCPQWHVRMKKGLEYNRYIWKQEAC